MPRPTNQDLQFARVAQIISATNLHERAFGEKVQHDADRLSLDQMKFLQTQANQQELLSLARARFQLNYRKQLASAAAIEQLGKLDTRGANYLKDRGEILSSFAEGIDSPGVKTVLEEQDKVFKSTEEGKKARASSTFTGQAKEAWDKAYANGGDMIFANKIGEAEQANVVRAQKLAPDPYLDPALKAKIYDSSTGRFNTDPSLLTQGEVDVQSKAAAAKLAASQVGNIEALTKLASSSSEAVANETVADKAAREATHFNAMQALKNASFAQMNKGAVPAAPAAPDDSAVGTEIQSLLSGGTPDPNSEE